MAFWKQLLLCVVVLAVAAGGWYYYRQGDGPSTETAARGAAPIAGRGQQGAPGATGPTLVVTEKVGSDIVADNVRAVGTVLVPRSINVYPQVTGLVTAVLFKAGDQVKTGQPLVILDESDQKVAVDLARVALDDAKKALDRAERLATTNNVTQAALQDARSVERKAEIGLESAEIALARRTITAPFDGVVGISALSVGDLVTPQTIVATLDDPSVMKASFLVPERYAGRITEGQPMTAFAESQPGTTIKGAISAVDTRVDASARTLKVEATLDAAAALAAGVRPGMSIRVDLPFAGTTALAVSALAIQWDRSGSYVWKQDGDGVARAPITILQRQSGRVLVASDALAAGDRIVVEGLQRLRPGVKVADLADRDAEAARLSPAVPKAEGS